MSTLFLSGVFGFLFGIVLLTFFTPSWPVLFLGVVLGTMFLALYAIQRHRTYLFAGILLFCAVFGMFRVLVVDVPSPVFESWIGQERSIEGVVVVDPDIREVSQRVTVEVREETAKTRMLVVTPLFPEVSYGDTVRVFGTVVRPVSFETDTGRTFSYDKFLAKDGVHLIMQNASIERIASRSGFWNGVFGSFADIKQASTEALARALPEPHASLASGLILGGKQGLGETMLDDFIRVGLVHIVVLSGYNVMIIAQFVMRVFGMLSRRTGTVLAVVTILLFILIAGAGAASVRAGIMASIALYARASGRAYRAFRALVFAGVLMLLASPLTLVYDPGFQLSFIATLGLIFGTPLVEKKLLFVKSAFLREITASTISAQIAVLPLLLYQNGLFSVVALPANLLVLPFIPLAMFASFVALLCGLVLPVVAPLVGFPAYLLLSYIVQVVETLSRLPFSAVSIPTFPLWVVVLCYALLAYTLWERRSRVKL